MQRPVSNRHLRWPAWLVAAALLALQSLALVHAVSHLALPSHSAAASAPTSAWGHAVGDGLCQALDHFCNSSALHAATPLIAALAGLFAPEAGVLTGLSPAPRWARQARGPPGRG